MHVASVPRGRGRRVGERQAAILALLKSHGSISIGDLASRLNCSPATIRRDLATLAASAGIRRFHGAVGIDAMVVESRFQERFMEAADAKLAIARCIVHEVKPGMVVGLNGGTTTTLIARAIAATRLAVTVVTNAVNIALELTTSGVPVVVVGGMLQPANYETTGPLAVELLNALHLDVAILGTNGLDPRFGANTHTEAEATVGRTFSERADRVVVAADASKFGRTALFRMVDWSRIHEIVSDQRAEATCRKWRLETVDSLAEASVWNVHPYDR